MKRNVLGVASRLMEDVEHPLSARVVERVDDDECVAMTVGVSGEPGGDGVTGALIITFVREVMFFQKIVVKKNRRVLALR